jgi:TonB family protein
MMRYLRCASLLTCSLLSLQSIFPNGAVLSAPQAPQKAAKAGPLTELQAAINIAITGNENDLKKFCELTTPGEIIASERDPKPILIDGLKRGHEVSLQLYKEKKYVQAANELNLLFLVIAMFGSMNKADKDQIIESHYIAACHKLGIPKKDFIPPLNDFGFYCQLAGDDDSAILMFKKVIAEAPEREVAYLNLADSLWKKGKEEEARPLYDKYQKLMVAENLAAKIPSEAKNRMSGTASVARSSYDSDADRERYGPYMQEVQLRIHEAWHAPTVSRTPGTAVVTFKVDAEGKVSDVKMTKASGLTELDQSCLNAATSVKLPPLPEQFERPTEVEFAFRYNLDDASDPKEQLINRWERKVKEADSPDNLIGLAQAYQSAKHYTKAEIIYRKAVAMKPANTYYQKLLDDCTKKEKSQMFRADPASAMK